MVAAQTYLNSSAYGFCVFKTDELPTVRKDIQDFAEELVAKDNAEEIIKGTVLLSEEGVNIRLSGTPAAVKQMQTKLRGLHDDLGKMEFKDSFSERVTLPKMLVRIKKEVISIGKPEVQPAVDGLAEHISPEEFKEWLDRDKDMVVLDTRNDYEVRLGTFEKAKDLSIKSFRAFPEAAQEQLGDLPKDKPIVMFCTGGVRCEKASYVLKNDGYKQVYQLDGGILKYFERCGGAHYKGDCFIFDDRVALKPDLTEGDAIACHKCRSPLTKEDQESEDYVAGTHCPHCKHGKNDFRTCENPSRKRKLSEQPQNSQRLSEQTQKEVAVSTDDTSS